MPEQQNTDLVYDLRMKYAQIVGTHLELVTQYRLERNWASYFMALENLYVITSNKIEQQEAKLIKKDNKDFKSYNKLLEECLKVINKEKSAYLGQSQDAESIYKVSQSLKAIEKHLIYLMDKANMFGSNRAIEGL